MPQGDSVEPGSNNVTPSLVLVVEDNLRTRNLEKFVLEEEGFDVAEAGSGEEALETLPTRDPALVLLDIGLPGMDGFATCQRIRQFSQVPIIMVTAEDKDEDKVRGLDLGADAYVTKPFSTNELGARVKAVLRRFEWTAAPAYF
jgi:DNA-binding response OmpR family regulator